MAARSKKPPDPAAWTYQTAPYQAYPNVLIHDHTWLRLSGAAIKLLLLMRAHIDKGNKRRFDPSRLPYSYSDVPEHPDKPGKRALSRNAYLQGLRNLTEQGIVDVVQEPRGSAPGIYNVVSRSWTSKNRGKKQSQGQSQNTRR